MVYYIWNYILKIQQTDNVKVQKETSKFLKSNFLRNDDFLLLIKCEKPNCIGHLTIDNGDLSTSKFTGRTEEVDCYIVSIK